MKVFLRKFLQQPLRFMSILLSHNMNMDMDKNRLIQTDTVISPRTCI